MSKSARDQSLRCMASGSSVLSESTWWLFPRARRSSLAQVVDADACSLDLEDTPSSVEKATWFERLLGACAGRGGKSPDPGCSGEAHAALGECASGPCGELSSCSSSSWSSWMDCALLRGLACRLQLLLAWRERDRAEVRLDGVPALDVAGENRLVLLLRISSPSGAGLTALLLGEPDLRDPQPASNSSRS
jgi:hypothetical protein